MNLWKKLHWARRHWSITGSWLSSMSTWSPRCLFSSTDKWYNIHTRCNNLPHVCNYMCICLDHWREEKIQANNNHVWRHVILHHAWQISTSTCQKWGQIWLVYQCHLHVYTEVFWPNVTWNTWGLCQNSLQEGLLVLKSITINIIWRCSNIKYEYVVIWNVKQ